MEMDLMDHVKGPQDVAIKSNTNVADAISNKSDITQPTENNSTIQVSNPNNSVDIDEERSSNKPVTAEGDEVKDCNDFDQRGDITPLEDVDSIFNCGGETGTWYVMIYLGTIFIYYQLSRSSLETLCEEKNIKHVRDESNQNLSSSKWFYPAKFLDATCGVGKEFISKVNKMKDLYEARELWLSGPPIVLPFAKIVPQSMRPNPYSKKPWRQHTISMTHVHKTGGTSLVTAFSGVASKGAKGFRHTVYMPGQKPYTGKVLEKKMADADRIEKLRGTRPKIGPRKSVIYGTGFNQSLAFLDGATKYKNEDDWKEGEHTLFAVVRDPADRFISAIGQATGAFGSSANGIGRLLLDECLKETSRDTLRCFIDIMYTNSTWIEVHFTPMLLEITFATIYKDIPVAVFPFQEVHNLMLELGANPDVKKKDGHAKGYRKSPILTNMTVADYDDDMLKRLCGIYKMDVMFMNQIGMTTKCDKVI